MRSRLYEAEQERLAAERGDARQSQIGSAERSEKIRTYNYPQDRISDHRIKMNLSNIPGVMDGQIDSLVQELRAADEAQSPCRSRTAGRARGRRRLIPVESTIDDTRAPSTPSAGALSFATASLRVRRASKAPRLDAELLLGHVIGKSRTRLAIDASEPIDSEIVAFDLLVSRRRIAGRSQSRISSVRENSWDTISRSDPGVLVPRPETELLVERAVDDDRSVVGQIESHSGARSLHRQRRDRAFAGVDRSDTEPRVITVQTGTPGQIFRPKRCDYATSKSTSRSASNDRVELVEGDLLAWTDRTVGYDSHRIRRIYGPIRSTAIRKSPPSHAWRSMAAAMVSS